MTQPKTINRRPLSGAWLALVAAVALLAGPAQRTVDAQAIDSVLRDFQPTGDFVLVVAGKNVAADIYLAERVPAYLVISPALPAAVLLSPRTGTAESLPPAKVSKRSDGSADLLADAEMTSQGKYEVAGEVVSFTIGGKRASLRPRPSLLGSRKSAELKSYSPEYARGANGYAPDQTVIAALKKEKRPVKVRVFFGSWCPHCKKHVPWLLKVEDQLKGSKIQFEYYGLPEPPNMTGDAEAKRLGIGSVPTGVIYVNGREAGRLSGAGWNAPEKALRDVLSGKAAQKGR